MKIEIDDLKLIALCINEPGFRIIEQLVFDKFKGYNNISRISGHAFDDGKQVGKAEAFAEIINIISDIRANIKSMEKE